MIRTVLQWLAAVLVLASSSVFAEDVDYRLPGNVTPTLQKINLNVDPDKPDYTGTTEIDITINQATRRIGFYQHDLTIGEVTVSNTKATYPLEVSKAGYDINWGEAKSDIAPGKYTLKITFSGKVNTSSDGMYLSAFEGNNYIFTQFEDMHARKAFPSFDEPSFKIPYQMTITAPEGQTVVSNTPVKNRSVDNGMQTVEFKQTKPMPTYLVAYVVGPFDSAPLTGLSVPGKIYVPKGYAEKTKFIVKHTPAILKSLETFFAIDYPYEKLDFVAVPNFTHGAMENAGLITYRDSLLLLPENPGLTAQASPLNVVAHELAHQWYGNLVTMAWWDDLWLNEAFASWMASYVMMELYPELNFKDRIIQEGAFDADASPTTKPVKKVVRSQADVMDGLGLNYSKGESILQMIESLIGTEKFREGIRGYMKKHAWGNTKADDLWAALDGVSDFNLSAMMKTYLEQPGYPLLSFDADGTVKQSRYHFAGADVKDQSWAVPLNITYKKNGDIERKVVFVDDKTTRIPALSEADWVFPNNDATGYFRWKVTAAQLDALLNDISSLNNREKKNVLYNTQALLTAGETDIGSVMKVLDAMAKDEDPVVVRSAVVTLMDFTYLVNDDNRHMFAEFVDAKFLPLLNELTLTAAESDNEATMSLRSSLYNLLGKYGEDESLQQRSEALAKSYLKDTDSLPPEIASAAIRVTTKAGDPAWFDKLLAAFKANDIPTVKQTLLYSMRFEDEATINKMFDLALTENITPANAIYMVSIAGSIKDDQSLLYTWLNENQKALFEKMPDYHIARMPEFVSATCDNENLSKAKQFYSSLKDNYDGMARSYDIMVDETQQCIRLKDTYQEDFNSFLKSVSAK